MKNRLLSLLAASILTSGFAAPATSDARHHHGEKSADAKKSEPTIEATLSSMHMDRPPRTSFEVNFVLQNPTAAPLWFLLPLALPLKPGNQISVLEEYRTDVHRTEVTVGRTLGLWAFQLMLLGPQSKVKLQRLPVAYWGDAPHGTVPLEVIVAPDLRIGTKSAQQWFTSDPTLKNGLDIKGEKLQLSTTKRAAPGQSTVVLQNERHISLYLALSNK